jgi:hypothetical protein
VTKPTPEISRRITRQKGAGKPFGPDHPGTPFKPGNKGRPKGSRHKVTRAVAELLDGQAEQITQKCIAKALEGDGVALRLCMDRLIAPTKDAPVKFTLSPVHDVADMASAGRDVLAAVSAGQLSPDEAARVIGLLGRLRDLLELVNIEERLKALEGNGDGHF